ncbi:hypothetical protein THAOC_18092 [Thalassiosira oceanica]|uniref:Uncharacterized protein n=1 Tax=Thalassiosira oceanica TaxID=159749 RepID=K0SK95_THAOC|nr:hypothetical protein THAOC_18092 [Thalassiosira oceanica]|eukprot:EJK61426.1 hypothetical protein THAOC_18092 [Thalassiosira oceanica]
MERTSEPDRATIPAANIHLAESDSGGHYHRDLSCRRTPSRWPSKERNSYAPPRRRSPSRDRRGVPSSRCEPSACDSHIEAEHCDIPRPPLAWFISECFLERAEHRDIRRPQHAWLVSERSLYHKRLGPLASWPDAPYPSVFSDPSSPLARSRLVNHVRLLGPVRYGLVPQNLEPICDGCGKRGDVEHYLSYPVGGLRNIRHDELGRTFATHAKDALSKAYVRREPRTIPSGEQRQDRNSNAAGANATSPSTPRREDRTRGDVSVYGFWARGTDCIFDVRVTDPSAKSYRKKDPRKVLETQEKEKRKTRREAKKAMKHLASMLAEKWERPHGQVAHFVKTSMAISLCRSVTLMLRGGRIRGPDRVVIHSGDAMECLQTGHDERP